MALFGLFGTPNVGRLRAEGNVPGLIKAVRYRKDFHIREAAVLALGEVGDRRAVGPLVAALRDKNRSVQQAAARALRQIEDVRALEPLVATLKDENRSVRNEAAEALGQLGDARAVEPLIVALKANQDDEWTVRAVAEALGKLGDQRAIKPLVINLLYGGGIYGRDAVNRALQKIDPKWMNSEAAKQFIPALVMALNDEHYGKRGNAAWMLGLIGDTRAVEPLTVALRDRDIWLRSAAASALGSIGDERAVNPLVGLAQRDKELAETTISALRSVLERATASVASEDLRAVARLRDPVIEKHVPSDQPFAESGGYHKLQEVDCSPLKQLAQQELIRRSLEV